MSVTRSDAEVQFGCIQGPFSLNVELNFAFGSRNLMNAELNRFECVQKFGSRSERVHPKDAEITRMTSMI